MFNKINKMKAHHQIFFALLIGSAVISFWRGLWGIMDLYIFPSNSDLSFWVSLIAGAIVLTITHYITRELE